MGDQNKGMIKVYNQNLSLVNTFKAHNGNVQRIKQSQFNKDHVATSSNGLLVKVWNASKNTNWTLIQAYAGHPVGIFAFDFINEEYVASSDESSLHIWSIKAGVKSMEINMSTSSGVRCLQYLPSVNGVCGKFLAAGLGNSKINIYNIANNTNGSLVTVLSGHTSLVNDLALISYGNILASSSWDNTVRIWYLVTCTVKYTLRGHTSAVYGLRLISSEILASGALDNTIILWNITSGNPIRTLTNHTNRINLSVDLLTYDDGSNILVSGSTDLTIKAWNWETGECLNTINTDLSVIALAVVGSTNGTFIINNFFFGKMN
jgi:F-box and WD-40 domain protein CDC4